MAEKLVNLRIFEDENGKLNRSLLDAGGAMLIVSQFTLYGDCRKGRRPSFIDAALPEVANTLYEKFVECVRFRGIEVATGEFQTHMVVSLSNDGPVTLILDSPAGESPCA
jgi:D-tyrosyl-tRNA(Tyr) deacylase